MLVEAIDRHHANTRKQVYRLEIDNNDKDTMLKLEKLMNFYEASWVVGKQGADRH
jgi:hypothetical protein